MTDDELRVAVREVKERTDAPFGVNFRADQPDLEDRIAFVVGEGVRIVSFAGAPTKDSIARIHDSGVLCASRRSALAATPRRCSSGASTP